MLLTLPMRMSIVSELPLVNRQRCLAERSDQIEEDLLWRLLALFDRDSKKRVSIELYFYRLFGDELA